MPLNKAQMLALLADNTSGDISAEDMRDIITGLVALEDEWVEPKASNLFQDVSTAIPEWVEGQMFYADGSINFHGEFAGVTLQIGQEQYAKVSNATGTDIPNGSAVYFAGLSGGYPAMALAKADISETARVVGVTTMVIPVGGVGLVTTFGEVRDLNTNSLTAGEALYLSDTIAGGFTNVPPDIATGVGTVLSKDLTSGKIFVKTNSLISLPTIYGILNNLVTPTVTVTATATQFKPFNTSLPDDNAVLVLNATNGTITVPSKGVYQLDAMIVIRNITAKNSPQEILIQAGVNGIAIGNGYPMIIGRDGSDASDSIGLKVHLDAGDTVSLMHSSQTVNEEVTYESAVFSLTSIHIR